jgi:hypothetical protein
MLKYHGVIGLWKQNATSAPNLKIPKCNHYVMNKMVTGIIKKNKKCGKHFQRRYKSFNMFVKSFIKNT